jgi:hypothetical protein
LFAKTRSGGKAGYWAHTQIFEVYVLKTKLKWMNLS